MPTLTADADRIITNGPRPVVVAVIDLHRAALVLTERGISYTLAQQIADGALSGKESTTALARQRRLVQ